MLFVFFFLPLLTVSNLPSWNAASDDNSWSLGGTTATRTGTLSGYGTLYLDLSSACQPPNEYMNFTVEVVCTDGASVCNPKVGIGDYNCVQHLSGTLTDFPGAPNSGWQALCNNRGYSYASSGKLYNGGGSPNWGNSWNIENIYYNITTIVDINNNIINFKLNSGDTGGISPAIDDSDFSLYTNGIVAMVAFDTTDQGTFELLDYQCYKITESPTINPSKYPTMTPTNTPSKNPSDFPTHDPSITPTKYPSNNPTQYPTYNPTNFPTQIPSVLPTIFPSNIPTREPTVIPTDFPTNIPSIAPNNDPTNNPTSDPSVVPTIFPSNPPSEYPSITPTNFPTNEPTTDPTMNPSYVPTQFPTINPTNNPTDQNSTKNPSKYPSITPTIVSTKFPSFNPLTKPTNDPITQSNSPTENPSILATLPPSHVFILKKSNDSNNELLIILLILIPLFIVILGMGIWYYFHKQLLNERDKRQQIERQNRNNLRIKAMVESNSEYENNYPQSPLSQQAILARDSIQLEGLPKQIEGDTLNKTGGENGMEAIDDNLTNVNRNKRTSTLHFSHSVNKGENGQNKSSFDNALNNDIVINDLLMNDVINDINNPNNDITKNGFEQPQSMEIIDDNIPLNENNNENENEYPIDEFSMSSITNKITIGVNINGNNVNNEGEGNETETQMTDDIIG